MNDRLRDFIKTIPTSISGVYSIVAADGRQCIGSSKKVRKRLFEHLAMLEKNKHHNQIVQNYVNKHGFESIEFRLLFECESELCLEAEQLALDHFEPEMNIIYETEKFLKKWWENPDFRERNAERCRQQNIANWSNPEYREKRKNSADCMNTPEAREKTIKTRAERLINDESYRKKLSETMTNTVKRLFQNEEHRKKHGARKRIEMLERCKDKEFCRKRDEAASKANSKPIRLIQTGVVYKSITDAAKKLKMNYQVIRKQIKGFPTKTGYKWEFVDKKEVFH